MSYRFSILAVLAWVLGAGTALGQAPTVSSFSPAFGPPGTQVTITGNNFSAATGVQFGNTVASFTILSATQIRATVPVNAETGVIAVYTPGGVASSVANFTVSPRIDSFTPASAPVGNQVTINGANFILGGTTVKFGNVSAAINITASTLMFATVPAGAVTGPLVVATFAGTNSAATNFIVTGTGPVITDFTPSLGTTGTVVVINGGDFTGATAVSFNSTNASFAVTAPTQIHATVPTNATTGLIRVTTPAGTGTSSSNFVVAGLLPIVTGFSPTSGKAGDPVVITGLNFTTVTNVSFNGTNAAFGVTADTQITAVVPTNISTGPIRITNPAGSVMTTSNFFTGPLITGFAPASGPVGTFVFINGVNFSAATNVAFNGVAAVFTITADTQLRATVPTNATTGPLRVTAPGGTNSTSSNFVVTASAPVISDFTPTNGLVGSVVQITGSSLTGATNVTFNGTNALFSVTADSQINATVPAGATTGPISIFGPGGSVTSSNLFYLPPDLTGFTPTNGVVGTVVTFSGTNFTGTTSVTFAGTNATLVAAAFTIISANTLTAIVPTNAATGALTITTPGGVIISTNSFGVAPRVDSFSPTLGPFGTVVTVVGLNFDTATAVRFNGVNAAFTANSPTQITAAVPFGSSPGPITVLSADGVGASVTNFIVTVPTDLAVTQSFTPAVALLGQSINYTIVVTNKGPSIVTGVVLTDTLPPGVAVVSAITSRGSISLANGVITASFGVFTNGTSAVVFLTVTPPAPGIYQNRAAVASVEGDVLSADNSSETFAPVITDAQRTLAVRALPASGEMLVSWPISSVNFQLQFNTNLVSFGNSWSNIVTTAVLFTNQSGVENHVTNPASASRLFFRLKSP